jgi:hypothetical protein
MAMTMPMMAKALATAPCGKRLGGKEEGIRLISGVNGDRLATAAEIWKASATAPCGKMSSVLGGGD